MRAKNTLVKASKRADHFLIILDAKPNANYDRIQFDGEFLIAETTSSPVKGKANKSIIKILSQKMEISKSQISLIKGATSRTKIFEVEMPNSSELEIIMKLQK